MLDLIAVAFDVKNKEVRDELEKIVASRQDFRISKNGDFSTAHLFILEMEDDHHKTFSRIQSILAKAPAAEVFLTATRTEPEVLLNALRAGVKEFIPQPIQREELEHALNRFKERHRGRRPDKAKNGKIINLIGSKGGVGTTTLAVNLAISLLESQHNSSVVLVDLNSPFGDVALFLDMEPAHTLADIAKNLPRLDATFLMSILSKHRSGMYVLPSPKAVEEIGALTPESVQQTLALLQMLFDYIVIDSGHALDDITVAALNMSPTVFLVSGLTIPIVRNTRRILDILSSVNYPTNDVKIIVNRYTKKSNVTLKDLEEVLQQKPFWMIPNDYFTTLGAINNGEPVSAVAPRTEIRKCFQKLAIALATEATQDKKPSFLGRLFRSNT